MHCINELLGQIVMQTQPRPQGFSLKKWEKAFSRPSHFLRSAIARVFN